MLLDGFDNHIYNVASCLVYSMDLIVCDTMQIISAKRVKLKYMQYIVERNLTII